MISLIRMQELRSKIFKIWEDHSCNHLKKQNQNNKLKVERKMIVKMKVMRRGVMVESNQLMILKMSLYDDIDVI